MSYVRPIRVDELIKWIKDNGYDEVSAETLAQALVDTFDIITTSMTAS